MRYFFHLSHDDPPLKDTIGAELSNDKAAWDEATKACGAMIKEIDGDLHFGTDWMMEVHDSSGPVFEIRFGAKRLR